MSKRGKRKGIIHISEGNGGGILLIVDELKQDTMRLEKFNKTKEKMRQCIKERRDITAVRRKFPKIAEKKKYKKSKIMRTGVKSSQNKSKASDLVAVVGKLTDVAISPEHKLDTCSQTGGQHGGEN